MYIIDKHVLLVLFSISFFTYMYVYFWTMNNETWKSDMPNK